MPESPAIKGVMLESSAIMDVMSGFPVFMNIAHEAFKAIPRCTRLVSSLENAPLMSVLAAGIPAVVPSQGVSEVVPLTTALHVTAIAVM